MAVLRKLGRNSSASNLIQPYFRNLTGKIQRRGILPKSNMALPKDFLHHLHELMVEVSDNLREEAATRKRQLVFEGRKANNSSATLGAYKEASLEAFRNRAERTIEKYIDALDVWGLELNDSVERDMLVQIGSILSAPNRFDVPPGLKHSLSIEAFQSSYAGELARAANALRRKAANRLREAKIRGKRSAATVSNDGARSSSLDQKARTSNYPREKQMTRHSANVLNVLIASPSDVSEEREVVTKSIHEWNAAHFSVLGVILNPIKWESHSYPASGDRPQAILNEQIVERGDILIGVFGYKLGSPTGIAQSGTIEEIEEFRKAGKYVALYFSTADVPRDADRDQLESLESYKKARQGDTLYAEFGDAQALHNHLVNHLPKIVHKVGTQLGFWTPAEELEQNSPKEAGPVAIAFSQRRPSAQEYLPDLNPKEIELLVSAARDPSGQILHRKTMAGDHFFVGGRSLLTSPTPRSVAELLGAIRSLVSLDLLDNAGLNGHMYKVTGSGYAAADLLVDFTRWLSNRVTVEARYLNAPTESLTFACSGVLQLPATYYQHKVRADMDLMRSEKEPLSLIVEGADPTVLNGLSWQPTDLTFVVSESTETKLFMVERTEDRRVVKFWIKGKAQ